MTQATPQTDKATQKQDNISVAQKALQTEIDGLQKLYHSIDAYFSDAVEAIHAMKTAAGHRGRLIVAGIGKSGHVGRKIAATMASTGTPSYFVHPGEASHGDLGMITRDDVVLMLSNSGENSELSDLIHYTRRYGMTLIAMTSNPDSTLGRHADIGLWLPKTPEACPNGLAPTTSTTMMMAYGDALAVALLERMGLTKEQYKVFHPGGKLGQRLMKVSELMIGRDDMPVAAATAKMDEALLLLTGKNMGAVVIVDDAGNVAGIITDGDLKRHMSVGLLQENVTKIMTPNPKSIAMDCLAAEALDIMTKKPGQNITSLIVTDKNGNLAGLIRLQDCIQAGLA